MGDVQIRPLGEPGDLGWMVQAHGELYAHEFGWDISFEAVVAGIIADFARAHDEERERGWIAELDGIRVGGVLCVTGDEPAMAKLRVLLVHPDARGHGLGTRLVETCVAFAREAGYQRIRLWTHDVQIAARRLYLTAGFHLVAHKPTHSFGVDMAEEHYELDLRPA
ncbi:MAG TPA: GNAT family N-acetyltransferase [Pseudonocardia sp.]